MPNMYEIPDNGDEPMVKSISNWLVAWITQLLSLVHEDLGLWSYIRSNIGFWASQWWEGMLPNACSKLGIWAFRWGNYTSSSSSCYHFITWVTLHCEAWLWFWRTVGWNGFWEFKWVSCIVFQYLGVASGYVKARVPIIVLFKLKWKVLLST